MPTRAHAQKASSASPSPPSKTVPFCAGPGLKARCCPARCPQSPSTPSKLQSPSTPSKTSKPVHPLQKEKGTPESVPFSFWSFGRKKSRLRPFHSNALGAQMLWGAPFPLCVFLRRIDSPKAAKKGGRKAAYAAVPAAGRGNIKAPQRRPFPLLRGQAKSRQAPSGGACRLFCFKRIFYSKGLSKRLFKGL